MPVGAIVVVAADRVSDARTCDTFCAADPVTPSAVAWIVAMPLAFDSTAADAVYAVSMRATELLVDAHVKVTPVIGASSVSRACARKVRRTPSDVIDVVSPEGTPDESRPTTMRVIGVMIDTFDTPVMAFAVARICVVPSVSALTTPEEVTPATAGAVDVHVKVGCAVIATPRPSTAAAVNVKPAPR